MKTIELKNLPDLSFDTQEALNQFRINLGFCGENIKKIMITSSVPNEGKSFISMQLWKMLADIGISTLLIDCDLRNSKMRSDFGLSYVDGDAVGIAHYLAGKANLDDVIYKTNVKNGYMIPSAGAIINPTILLEQALFDKMLKKVEDVFGIVIIDTPPIGSVADALNIATKVDGTVLVVRSNDTPRRLISNSVQLLERTSTPLLGAVLNRIDTHSSGNGYYSRYYKGYYSYYYNGYGYGYGNNNKKTKGKEVKK